MRKLIALARERGADDPLTRDRVAREWIDLQALKLTNYRALTTLMQTGIPGPGGLGVKLHWSEQNQRLTKLALELHGPEAQLMDGEPAATGSSSSSAAAATPSRRAPPRCSATSSPSACSASRGSR